ncbi:hypothetical protein Noda2021_11730 [Candidatus Dependentiae bacterium Noda2021]|nr:hypothetical protein Noda2021_11730 [Candidatus Dependentiae bacterium Noda2021]
MRKYDEKWTWSHTKKLIEYNGQKGPQKSHKQQIKDESYQSLATLIEKSKSTQKGLPEGWTRATFIVEEKMNEKIRALAYWERLTVKEIMYEALSTYLKGKHVKPLPQKKNLHR